MGVPGPQASRLGLFLRGWLMVSLVSANTVQIAQGRYLGAFVVGFAISALWWTNSGSSGRSKDWRDGPCYALGAAAGTVTGMLVTRWWYA